MVDGSVALERVKPHLVLVIKPKIQITDVFNKIGNFKSRSRVFCDFYSEPGFAWNLILSFSLFQKQVNCESVIASYRYQTPTTQ